MHASRPPPPAAPQAHPTHGVTRGPRARRAALARARARVPPRTCRARRRLAEGGQRPPPAARCGGPARRGAQRHAACCRQEPRATRSARRAELRRAAEKVPRADAHASLARKPDASRTRARARRGQGSGVRTRACHSLRHRRRGCRPTSCSWSKPAQDASNRI